MLRPTQQRLVTLVLACAWVLPGLLALAVTLHVGLHHHDRHSQNSPSDRVAELALAVEHGHSHELDAPAHEHPVTRSDGRCAPPAPGEATALPGTRLRTSPSRRTEVAAPEPLRPPPRPLFSLHCALLS